MSSLLQRFEQLYGCCHPDIQSFILEHRWALIDRWIVEELEKAPKPLSRDSVLSVMIEALRRRASSAP